GTSSGLDGTHWLRLLPFLSVFQMTPWKESETYTLPDTSKQIALGPAPTPSEATSVVVLVTGFHLKTLLLPRSAMKTRPFTGLKAMPSTGGAVPVSVTVRMRCPAGLNTQSFAGPGTKPSALKPPLGT